MSYIKPSFCIIISARDNSTSVNDKSKYKITFTLPFFLFSSLSSLNSLIILWYFPLKTKIKYSEIKYGIPNETKKDALEIEGNVVKGCKIFKIAAIDSTLKKNKVPNPIIDVYSGRSSFPLIFTNNL